MVKNTNVENAIKIGLPLLLTLYIISEVQGLSSMVFLTMYFLKTLIIISFIILLRKEIYIKLLITLFPLIIFELIYLVQVYKGLELGTILSIMRQGVFIILVYVVAILNWNKKNYKFFFIVSLISLVFVYFNIWIVYTSQEYFWINPNSLGAISFFLLYFPFIYLVKFNKSKWYYYLLIITTLFFLFLSATRSIFVVIAFFIFTILTWNFITKRKFIFKLYFLSILLLIFTFIFMYQDFESFIFYDSLEKFSQNYLGKTLMSGRSIIWSSILSSLDGNLLLGHGVEKNVGEILNINLSAHNLYLHILFKTGLIGVMLFIWFLSSVWNMFWETNRDKEIMVSAAFFIAILIYQTFDVTLLYYNFKVGIIQWVIVGFGIYLTMNKYDRSNTPE